MPGILARGAAQREVLFARCDIVNIAQRVGESVGDTGTTYYAIGGRFGFHRLRETAQRIRSDNRWQTIAMSAIVVEL